MGKNCGEESAGIQTRGSMGRQDSNRKLIDFYKQSSIFPIVVLNNGINRVAQKLLYNRASMSNKECQVTFYVPMYFHYLCRFGLVGNSGPLCL